MCAEYTFLHSPIRISLSIISFRLFIYFPLISIHIHTDEASNSNRRSLIHTSLSNRLNIKCIFDIKFNCNAFVNRKYHRHVISCVSTGEQRTYVGKHKIAIQEKRYRYVVCLLYLTVCVCVYRIATKYTPELEFEGRDRVIHSKGMYLWMDGVVRLPSRLMAIVHCSAISQR